MLSVEAIARVCHEVNRALCAAAGDHSQLSWAEAPEWQRESSRQGVRFAIAHPYAGPEAQHQAWADAKRADGWRYGEAKDADAKTHPCLLPFTALPFEQRVKDYAFRALVDALHPPCTGIA